MTEWDGMSSLVLHCHTYLCTSTFASVHSLLCVSVVCVFVCVCQFAG